MLRQVTAAGVLAAAALGIWMLPAELPVTHTVPGRVFAAREWLLVRDADGNLESMVRDRLQGTVSEYAANRFDRGDVVRLVFGGSGGDSRRVEAGDTIATIHSSETQRQYAALAAALDAATAELRLYTSGEKEAVIREAEMSVARAREELEHQRKEVERLRALHERALVSGQDFDLAVSRVRVLQAEADVALARLEAVRTGAKPEQIDLARARIEGLTRELAALESRQNGLTITSPLAGRTASSFSPDTLVTVRDTSAYVVIMPVEVHDRAQLRVGLPASVSVYGHPIPIPARITGIGDEVHVLGGKQVILATARIDGPVAGLLPGSVARCRIELGSLSATEYLTYLFRTAFS